jgi:hypothetical protein
VLRYFRVNDPYRLLALLVMMTVASLPLLIDLPSMTVQELKGFVLGEALGGKRLYVEVIDKTAPMMALTDGLLDYLFGRSIMARHVLALVIVFFQTAYFGILLINSKAYNESNYVPSLIFGFLCFFSFDLLATTPELLASTLLLLALANLFREIEFRVDRDSLVLNMGIFLGLASLFIFSYTVFLIGSLIILIIFARATFRKILLTLFGYGLVHAVLLTVYYSYGRIDELWSHFYAPNLSLAGTALVSMRSMFTLGAIPLIYFIFSLFMLTREARFTKYQSQLFQVIFFWLAVAMVQVWLAPERTPHSFFTFVPSLAYFISHYLLLIRRRFISEAMLWLLIIGLLTVNLTSRYGRIQRVDFSAMFPKSSEYASAIANKKVMVVGDDISLFQQNKLSGYFLDWDLSRKYFESPDYYENIVKINDSITSDPPDVIVDEVGMMDAVAERIPLVKRNYRKEDTFYWKR